MIHKYKRLAVGADIQDESKVHKEANYSKVCLFDVETGRLLFTTAQDQFGIDVVAHSPDGKWLVVSRAYGGGGDTFNILDAETGRQSFGNIPNVGGTGYVSFSPDSRYMLAVARTHAVALWDFKQQREVWRLKNIEVLHAVFHPDGKRFITVTDDGCVAVHATREGREVVTLETERAWLPVTFSPDGHQLIYRQDNGHMRILHSDDWTFPDKEAAFKAALRDVQQELNITP